VSDFIAKTLQRYEGREEALVTALQERYGLTSGEICVRQQPLTAAAEEGERPKKQQKC
jgi:hypothetical protein